MGRGCPRPGLAHLQQFASKLFNFQAIGDDGDDIGISGKDLWKEMAELGWAGILIPEEYGCSDFGMMGLGGILEETGRNLVPSPLFSTALLGVSLILLGGNTKQKKDLLPKIVQGKLTTAFALEEGPRHSPYNISTVAKKKVGNFILEGTKTFVLDGHTADNLIVAVRTSGKEKFNYNDLYKCSTCNCPTWSFKKFIWN